MTQSIFTDGGTIGKNPSRDGGTWAWCRVAEVNGEEIVIERGSGVLRPNFKTIPQVTNNHTEFYALLNALEALPPGWLGKICSDSQLTLCRFFVCLGQTHLWPLKNICQEWIERKLRVVKKLGKVEVVLLSGHPTKADLERGIGKRGTPVSRHNVWCDKECQRLAKIYAPRKEESRDEVKYGT